MFGFENLSQFTQVVNTSERSVNVPSAEMLRENWRGCSEDPLTADGRSTEYLLTQQGVLVCRE